MKINIYKYLSLLAALLIFGSAQIVAQQTKTWTGNTSTNWNTGSNWNPTGVPGNTNNVTIPNTARKPVLTANTTIRTLTINGGELTIQNGAKLTITRNNTDVNIQSGGKLYIVDGDLDIQRGTIVFSGNNNLIEVTDGSITIGAVTSKNLELKGSGSSIHMGDGSLQVYGNLTVSANTNFYADNGTVTTNGTTSISGTYYNNTGNTTFKGNTTVGGTFRNNDGTVAMNGNLTVSSGGTYHNDDGDTTVNGTTSITGSYYGDSGTNLLKGAITVNNNGRLYLNTGSITSNGKLTVNGSNGKAYFGEGEVTINNDVELSGGNIWTKGGEIQVQDATFIVTGDLTMGQNTNLSLDTGYMEVHGDFEIGLYATFEAGSSTVNLKGDLAIDYWFLNLTALDAGESTFIFSGTNQTITGREETFYNVIIEEGTTVNTNVGGNTITVENDLSIGGGGELNVNGSDKVNVQGEVNGDEEAFSPSYPYAVSATAPTLTTVIITFNTEMDKTSSENKSNYSINRVDNNGSVSISTISLNTGGNKKEVTITLSSSLVEDIQYVVTMNNVKNTSNNAVSSNHKKYFMKHGPLILYSRKSGAWDSNDTWSKVSHTGAAYNKNPNTSGTATIIVGNGHTVSISVATDITNHTSLAVNTGSILEVVAGGTLTLGTKVIGGAGTFKVTTGTLEIGSTAGISASGATGNVQTTTRNFGTSGSYTYNGAAAQITGSGLPGEVNNLKIDNANGVTLAGNLEVGGTLYLTNGAFIIESGYSLIANTKSVSSGKLRMKREITGTKGWRLFSSPIASTYGDLLDGITTQGYSGSTLGSAPIDSLQPNVMYYVESYSGTDNQRWRAPAAAAASLTAGRGLYTYIFGNVTGDARYNDNLPVTLSVEGQENDGNIDFGVTYTTSADSGWSLIGNPYAASIDWDKNADWTKTNMDNTIYIWDYASNQYKTWNGTTGDLADGRIMPFQGFWVKANAAGPELVVKKTAKTTGGTFVGKALESIPIFSVSLTDGKNAVGTHFMFTENGKIAKDNEDGYRLVPPPGIESYLDFASLNRKGDRLSINNLPRKFGIPIEIPLYLNAYENGYSVSKSMELKFSKRENIPDGWAVTLIDTKTGSEIDMLKTDSYTFNFEGEKNKEAPNSVFGTKPKITHKSKAEESRFLIRIEPGYDADDLPDKFELMQNFPNPFNPSTNIRFSLPLQSFVSLKIYDILGREVDTIVNKELDAGEYTFNWNAQSLASGVYLYRLVSADAVFTKKMTLIK